MIMDRICSHQPEHLDDFNYYPIWTGHKIIIGLKIHLGLIFVNSLLKLNHAPRVRSSPFHSQPKLQSPETATTFRFHNKPGVESKLN